jgi:iron complex outermembrane recepter protein
MKKYIAALVLVWAALFAPAQNNLTGTITDKTDNTQLFGATVYIPDLKQGATTDINGHYTIANLPAGSFLVEVRYLNYNTQVQTVAINGNTTQNFVLQETVAEVQEVIVTGVSKATDLRKSPVPAIIISKNAMLQQGSSNIIDAIGKQPGINQLTTGSAVSKPIIRGLGYNRVVTLNNGLRQEGQQWGDEHGIEIDEYSIDRVEVIKGPGSLMYGSDAMAGVINLLAPQPIDNGKIIGNLLTNYQTNNRLMGISGMTAGNINGINWMARVSSKQAAAYTNRYDGRVFNSGFNEVDFNGTIGINKKWGYSHLSFSSFNQNIGMVEGGRDSLGHFTRDVATNDTTVEAATVPQNELNTYTLGIPRQRVNHNRVSLQNLFILGKSRLGVNLSYQQNQRREFGDALTPNSYQPYFLLQTFSYDIKYYLPEIHGWETTVGLGGMQQQNKNKGIEFIIPAYNLFDYGLFAVTKKTFGKLNLSGGVRFDERLLQSDALYLDANKTPVPQAGTDTEIRFPSFKRNFSNVTGSVGGTYSVNRRLLLKLNVARGFRAPNMSELAANGKHEGTLRYEYGNVNLHPEASLQADLGASYTSEHITFEASVFQNRIQNYIYQQKLASANGGDSIADPTNPVPAYQYTQGNATLTGGEISIDIHPHPWDWLHFQNSFSYVQGVNNSAANDSSKHLPFMPPAHYQSELRANLKKAGKYLKNPYVFVQYDVYFAQNKVLSENSTETATKDYQLLNAGAGTAITNTKGNTLFNIYITANNLLDAAYQNHLSRLKYADQNPVTGRTGVYNMGRNISIKVSVPLVFKR